MRLLLQETLILCLYLLMKKQLKQSQQYQTKLGSKRRFKALRRKKKGSNPSYFSNHDNQAYHYNNEILSYLKKKIKLNKRISQIEILPKYNKRDKSRRILRLPSVFSLVEAPRESFEFIHLLFITLHKDKTKKLIFDYSRCSYIGLEAQVYMDVILKFFIDHLKNKNSKYSSIQEITAINIYDEEILKLLFSVGSYAIMNNKEYSFDDIIPYRLCIGNRLDADSIGNKEIDTTKLIDYVLECLKRVNKILTPDRLRDLSQIIGEVLANAEEHSSLNHRFSIGYYKDKEIEGKHCGLFNLVILNFGQTIYEKFKAPDCPTKHIVRQMKNLSSHYKNKKFFFPKELEEETLWTLYSLQEGVTSKANYKKRGNGSIRFIESFFNLGGNNLGSDGVSKLTILSGNTEVIFDGTYQITTRTKDNNTFKIMSFNSSGNLNLKPDKRYVKLNKNYFPGTLISAKILLTEEDTTNYVNKEKNN